MNRKIRIITVGQLLASALTLAFSVTYPGIMVVISAGFGLLYLMAAYYAHKQSRPAIWLAFVLSTFTLWLSSRFLLPWLNTGYPWLYDLSALPLETIVVRTVLLTVFLILLTVVLLHLWCWRWLVFGPQHNRLN